MINTWSIPDKVEDLYPKRALELEKSRRTLVDYFLKNKIPDEEVFKLRKKYFNGN